MVKRRTKHPLQDSPFIEGFLEWMDAPEGQQSIQALDQVFDALEHAGVDARHRKIVWADGNGYRSSSRWSASTLTIRVCLAI
jgi:hypothetical protein